MKDRSSITIDPVYRHEFLLEKSRINLQRGKLFAKIIIGIELALLMILLSSNIKHTSFEYNWYAFMYLLMIAVTAGVLSIFSYVGKRIDYDYRYVKTLEFSLTSYVAFIMIWGAMISLNDQVQYGSIIVFFVNVFIASFMFYLRPAYTFISLLVAGLIFFICLPYYQHSSFILAGHYINTSIYMIFVWFLARENYTGFVRNFLDQKVIEEKSRMLERSNSQLLTEIQIHERTKKDLQLANEQLLVISTLDALTGIPNRRRLDEVLQDLWNTAVVKQMPIAIMMIDIDFFKLYNDTHGHLAGDHCLQAVAEVLNACRQNEYDFVARFGGEEFIFVSVGMSKADTLLLGENIRLGIEELGIEHEKSPVAAWVTVSLGISHTHPGKTDKLTNSLERADQALYKAKSEGRNQLVLAD